MALIPSAPDVMEWKLSDLHGINLFPVSSIPGLKWTRQKDYDNYYIDITVFTGEDKKFIAENLRLSATSDHQWLDSIQTFPATFETKIKFEIYGRRIVGHRKHLNTAEGTIKDLFDARDESAVVKLDLVTPNHTNEAKLFFTLKAVSDGNREEMKEAVAQAGFQGITTLPSAFVNTADAVETANPFVQGVISFTNTWGGVLKKLETFQSIGTHLSEIHPYAKMAWSILNFIPMEVQKQVQLDTNVTSLAEIMNDTFDMVEKADQLKRESKSKIIIRMIQQTTECAWFIRDYMKIEEFWKRMAKNVGSSRKDQVDKFKSKFTELQAAFQSEGIVEIEIAVLRVVDDLLGVKKDINELVIEERLKDMRYSRNARFNSEKICLPNTQTAILDKIFEWIASDNQSAGDGERKSIFLLHGMAGTGKSTIANTIAMRLSAMERLGSSFCFSRDDRIDRNAENMFSTIARDMADLDPCFKVKLAETLNKLGLRSSGVPSEQFSKFIVDPMQPLTGVGVFVIVIDALDECENQASILRVLSKQKLPENICFIITTRPEGDIMGQLKDLSHVLPWDANEASKEMIFDDIKSYIRDRFSEARLSFTEHDIEKLAAKAAGLFQWAATACNYITEYKAGANCRKRFNSVLLFDAGLDSLYTAVLKDRISSHPEEINSVKAILAKVLAAAEPLSIEMLKALCQTEDEQQLVDDVIPALGAVLSVYGANVLRPLHTSFRDYLTSQDRSGSFFVDINQGHQGLLYATFGIMKKELHFNICQIESSYLFNSSLTNEQLNLISPPLFYSCQFWAYHLESQKHMDVFEDKILDFLKNQLLFWLEVMSCKKASTVVIPAMELLLDSQETKWADLTVIALAKDAITFIQNFSLPLWSAVPHIYLSALALLPSNSKIYQHYAAKFPNLLHCTSNVNVMAIQGIIQTKEGVTSINLSSDGKKIVSGSSDRTICVWDAKTLQQIGQPLTGHSDCVISVAFSPNGKQIVSGSYDKTICVWDAETLKQIGQPLTGHGGWVTSVAFSPNGKQIASGSYDKTVCVWNAETLKQIGQPLTGPNHFITSVAFSPNGKQIASGSDDKTVCVWDAETLKQIGQPLTGHSDYVTSVTFSPNGKQIASGSNDKTIWIWDAETLKQIGQPLIGHSGCVTSIAFSPNGKQIVSGSYDKTICIWDAETLKQIGQPFTGPNRYITSVAFSPNGRQIVSGSDDKTICVWDAETPNQISQPLRSHSDYVTSVTFSPNGKQIVSGSDDKTICVWDAETLKQVGQPLTGHSDYITSVAFSPNGKQIVSGSDDETICVWDAETLKQIGQPLTGHSNYVTSVAFSPNGKQIVSGSYDKTVCVWDAETLKQIGQPLTGHSDYVTSVAFSPNGKQIVSSSYDKTIWVWNAETLKQIGQPLTGHNHFVTSVAFSPDGKQIASGSDDKTVCVWDAETLKQIGHPLTGHRDYVTSVAFSSNGMQIVSGSGDKTICVWDTETLKQIGQPLTGHGGCVTSVAFSSDGKKIVSGSDDKTIRLWDVEAMQQMNVSYISQNIISYPLFSHHGYLLPEYRISDDHWVLNTYDEPLFWIPPHFFSCFPHPFLLGIINVSSMHHFDPLNFVYGKQWEECLGVCKN